MLQVTVLQKFLQQKTFSGWKEGLQMMSPGEKRRTGVSTLGVSFCFETPVKNFWFKQVFLALRASACCDFLWSVGMQYQLSFFPRIRIRKNWVQYSCLSVLQYFFPVILGLQIFQTFCAPGFGSSRVGFVTEPGFFAMGKSSGKVKLNKGHEIIYIFFLDLPFNSVHCWVGNMMTHWLISLLIIYMLLHCS